MWPQVDALPPALSGASFSMADWEAWHVLRTRLHKLTVGLDFMVQV